MEKTCCILELLIQHGRINVSVELAISNRSCNRINCYRESSISTAGGPLNLPIAKVWLSIISLYSWYYTCVRLSQYGTFSSLFKYNSAIIAWCTVYDVCLQVKWQTVSARLAWFWFWTEGLLYSTQKKKKLDFFLRYACMKLFNYLQSEAESVWLFSYTC